METSFTKLQFLKRKHLDWMKYLRIQKWSPLVTSRYMLTVSKLFTLWYTSSASSTIVHRVYRPSPKTWLLHSGHILKHRPRNRHSIATGEKAVVTKTKTAHMIYGQALFLSSWVESSDLILTIFNSRVKEVVSPAFNEWRDGGKEHSNNLPKVRLQNPCSEPLSTGLQRTAGLSPPEF